MDSIASFIAPHEQTRLLRYREARLEGKLVPLEYEYEALRKDGSLVVLRNLVRVVNWQGQRALQNTVIDVTRLRHYQDQLTALASEMSLTEERERRRIAADLHDHTVQNLGLSRIKLGALRKTLSSADGTKILNELQSLVDQTIRETRSLVFELSPPVLYELGLEPAVEWLAEQAQERYGIACRVRNDRRAKPVDKDLQIVLFQALRELLANAGKHAKATKAKITISRHGEEMHITVEDDGVGFKAARKTSGETNDGGFGLFSIRERLAPLGGRVDIASAPGQGTRVTLTAPLKRGAGD